MGDTHSCERALRPRTIESFPANQASSNGNRARMSSLSPQTSAHSEMHGVERPNTEHPDSAASIQFQAYLPVSGAAPSPPEAPLHQRGSIWPTSPPMKPIGQSSHREEDGEHSEPSTRSASTPIRENFQVPLQISSKFSSSKSQADAQPISYTSAKNETASTIKSVNFGTKDSLSLDSSVSMVHVSVIGSDEPLGDPLLLPSIVLTGDAGIFDDEHVSYESSQSQQMIFHLMLRRQSIYLVDHHLTEARIDTITSITPERAFTRKVFQLAETKAAKLLDTHILNKFIMRKANQIHETKLTDEPPVNLLDLSKEERAEIWRQEWEKDPKTLVSDMWKPVVQHVDLEAIFNCPDHARAAMKNLMTEWKAYYYECFTRAIEEATCRRIPARELPELTGSQKRAKKRAKNHADMMAFGLWRGLTRRGKKISVPELRLLPVTAFIRSGVLHKKVTEKGHKRTRSTSPTRDSPDVGPVAKRQKTT